MFLFSGEKTNAIRNDFGRKRTISVDCRYESQMSSNTSSLPFSMNNKYDLGESALLLSTTFGNGYTVSLRAHRRPRPCWTSIIEAKRSCKRASAADKLGPSGRQSASSGDGVFRSTTPTFFQTKRALRISIKHLD